ncbi:uncharacterized protein A4U43_C05F3600 [Asparagus officinalis]|uniref:Uncharacterized protein n=1 Tax=Asparagus officinalis TaxID=4686 RepID=A0A5P1ETA0_ASPOF|nr:uncharacterized protein LOC109843444 isoform X2 [Asparagus officinalis]ONK67771.1 uncharacterized protein A4U43_C05F3600 [Asparagus officinalis]
MMKSKAAALTVAERCRSILGANSQAHLNTIKADSKGSKSEIHTSKVHYIFKRGKPYLWVHEGDLHNTNIIIDERGSLSVSNVVPGPLMGLLKSIRKLPARVALAGDVIPLKDDKVQMVTENLRESILSEYEKATQASYAVTALLSSASANCRSRCEILQEILGKSENYAVYKFNIRSCTYVDGSGHSHDLELQNVDAPKAEQLLSFSAKLIDGINQSQARRRALMLFCFEEYNATVRDALMLSIDRKGFDVLGKVAQQATNNDGLSTMQYTWKEFRFSFEEQASDLEAFCSRLIELEEKTLQSVKSYSGLG